MIASEGPAAPLSPLEQQQWQRALEAWRELGLNLVDDSNADRDAFLRDVAPLALRSPAIDLERASHRWRRHLLVARSGLGLSLVVMAVAALSPLWFGRLHIASGVLGIAINTLLVLTAAWLFRSMLIYEAHVRRTSLRWSVAAALRRTMDQRL